MTDQLQPKNETSPLVITNGDETTEAMDTKVT